MTNGVTKRGRPPKNTLASKEEEGLNSTSRFKCKYCNRLFGLNKHLKTHERTHTGDKPYKCDYPGCYSAFAQSGQCRSHMYLHTGEKPYACSATGCTVRFTHSNRTCPEHPLQKLMRDGNHEILAYLWLKSAAKLKWLKKYERQYYGTVTKVYKPKTSKQECNVKRKRSIESVQSDKENEMPVKSSTPVTRKNYKSCRYGSRSNSNSSSSEIQDKLLEEMNIDVDSFIQSSKTPIDRDVVEAAKILMLLKYGQKEKRNIIPNREISD